MSGYRRSHSAGGAYFFAVVSYRRQVILCEARIREALREAIVSVRGKRPFKIAAWVGGLGGQPSGGGVDWKRVRSQGREVMWRNKKEDDSDFSAYLY